MDLSTFGPSSPGSFATITGTDPLRGEWKHKAFIPDPLPIQMPQLSPETYLAVANSRAALASLDSVASQLPNPALFRLPTLRKEAQSTSALEGTYAPLNQVLLAAEDTSESPAIKEIMNYVRMANIGFSAISRGESLTVPFIAGLQGILMSGTALEDVSGKVRDTQVVIGKRDNAANEFAVFAARFIPPPGGLLLESGIRDLLNWMNADHSATIDPVVAAAMSHYQFETLHPFRDGNGRIGRFLIVLHLLHTGVLTEPTLTVSPWFEARRADYYDSLLGVSTQGNWDGFVRFFSKGLTASAEATRSQMTALVDVQETAKAQLRASRLRADSARALIDLAIANPVLTVRDIESQLKLSYSRANGLIAQLTELGILKAINPDSYTRRFYIPAVIDVLAQ